MKKLIFGAWAVALGTLLLAGCVAPPGRGDALVRVQVAPPASGAGAAQKLAAAAASGGVDHIDLTVSAPDIDTYRTTITGSDTISLLIRAGAGRAFNAEAYDAAGAILYRGRVVVDLPDGEATDVGIDCFSARRIEDPQADLLTATGDPADDPNNPARAAARFFAEYAVSEAEPADIEYLEMTKDPEALVVRVGFYVDPTATELVEFVGLIEIDSAPEQGSGSICDLVRTDGGTTGGGVDWRVELFNVDNAYLVDAAGGNRQALGVVFTADSVEISIPYASLGISAADDPKVAAIFGNRGGPTDFAPNAGAFNFAGDATPTP